MLANAQEKADKKHGIAFPSNEGPNEPPRRVFSLVEDMSEVFADLHVRPMLTYADRRVFSLVEDMSEVFSLVEDMSDLC